jgi:hypothetical protein
MELNQNKKKPSQNKKKLKEKKKYLVGFLGGPA